MAHTNNWDETVPTNTTNATDIDDHIRKVRLDIRERFGIDHKIASSDDADVAFGVHTKITFEAAITEPSLAVDESCIYVDDGDLAPELRYLDSRGISNMMCFVGEVKMRMGYTLPEGWLALNGETIGNATSGADNAHADFEELFTFLWEELADAQAPVSTGRGANAAADWAASETLTMPDSRARMPIGVGTPQYEKLEYTSGGTHTVIVGDTLDGDTSATTCVVVEVVLLTGSWAAGTAAGYFVVKDVSAAFQAENLSEGANGNVCTIGADSVPYTTRVIGEIGGTETKNYENHTHTKGSFAVGSHNHSCSTVTGAGPRDYPVNTGSRYPTVFSHTHTIGSTAPTFTGTSAISVGLSIVDVVNPFLSVAFLIKY